MRTFVAIDIPDEIRSRIEVLIATLRRVPANVRWSRPEALHITLKFLGEIPAENVDTVKLALHSLPDADPVTIRIAGAGFFPSERTPRVLWLGIESGPELGTVAAAIEQRLVPLGVPPDERPFSPHLTLGRIRAANGMALLRDILSRQGALSMGSFTASEFFLYESQLAPGGSIYRKLARFSLSQQSPARG
jgi:2'-5' RNA ligase